MLPYKEILFKQTTLRNQKHPMKSMLLINQFCGLIAPVSDICLEPRCAARTRKRSKTEFLARLTKTLKPAAVFANKNLY